jgi:hypothetical protein
MQTKPTQLFAEDEFEPLEPPEQLDNKSTAAKTMASNLDAKKIGLNRIMTP